MWDAQKEVILAAWEAHSSCVPCIQDVGDRVISGSYDGTVCSWDKIEKTSVCSPSLTRGYVYSVSLKSKVQDLQHLRDKLFIGCADRSIFILNERTGARFHEFRPTTDIGNDVGFTSSLRVKDDGTIVMGFSDGTIRCFTLRI